MASGVTLEIEGAKVRFLEGAVEYARAGAIPAGLQNNRDFIAPCVEGSSKFDDLLYDPQTSGGLLVSLPEADAASLEQKFPTAHRVGRVLDRQTKQLRIV